MRLESLNDESIPDCVTCLMNRYDPDPRHARQVSRIALLLYDNLEGLHGFSREERSLLMYAALLHDTGWSVTGRPHHKGSMDIILSDTTIPLSTPDRLKVALIARYHRKSSPSPSHKKFMSLSARDQAIIRWAAAVLRTADALDRAHQSIVRDLTLEISEKTLLIQCISDRCVDETFPVSPEVFMSKTTLLSEITGREVTLIWKYRGQM
ncbi:MAG TPA: HD domain-containing protein [Methanospirillum sp.]|nr:HD domain-containing protein [Methanospirillum sp.]